MSLNIYDLCSEITLYYNYYKKYINLEHISVIDPLILYQNAYKNFNQWNPIKAIIGEKIPWYNLISCQDFEKKTDKELGSRNLISKDSLIEFYRKYNPTITAAEAAKTLEKYEHTRLLGYFEKKYGAIPELNII
jgi:hypothetical protein